MPKPTCPAPSRIAWTAATPTTPRATPRIVEAVRATSRAPRPLTTCNRRWAKAAVPASPAAWARSECGTFRDQLSVAADGRPIPPERVLARHVACDNFQDAEAFLRGGGERGSGS